MQSLFFFCNTCNSTHDGTELGFYQQFLTFGYFYVSPQDWICTKTKKSKERLKRQQGYFLCECPFCQLKLLELRKKAHHLSTDRMSPSYIVHEKESKKKHLLGNKSSAGNFNALLVQMCDDLTKELNLCTEDHMSVFQTHFSGIKSILGSDNISLLRSDDLPPMLDAVKRLRLTYNRLLLDQKFQKIRKHIQNADNKAAEFVDTLSKRTEIGSNRGAGGIRDEIDFRQGNTAVNIDSPGMSSAHAVSTSNENSGACLSDHHSNLSEQERTRHSPESRTTASCVDSNQFLNSVLPPGGAGATSGAVANSATDWRQFDGLLNFSGDNAPSEQEDFHGAEDFSGMTAAVVSDSSPTLVSAVPSARRLQAQTPSGS